MPKAQVGSRSRFPKAAGLGGVPAGCGRRRRAVRVDGHVTRQQVVLEGHHSGSIRQMRRLWAMSVGLRPHCGIGARLHWADS